MSPEALSPAIFSRAWTQGLQTVRDKAIHSLEHMTVIPNLSPPLYKGSCQQLRDDIEIILQIGLSRLIAEGTVKAGLAGYFMASVDCGSLTEVSGDARECAE